MSQPPAARRLSLNKVLVARILCAVPFLYLAGGIVYALLNASDFASALPQFIRYVVAPLVLASGLVFAAVARGGKHGAIVGVYACAVLAALFLHEIVATSRLTRSIAANASALYASNEASSIYMKSLPPGSTARKVANLIEGTRLDNVLLGAIPGRDTLLCNGISDNLIAYRADRFGFNNPDDVYSAGALDIAIFGDSFVEGMCLAPGEDIASRVRETIPRTASFGFRGAGPLMELAALGRFGPVLAPRLSVIVYFAGNDFENLETELGKPWLREALNDGASFGDPAVTPAQVKNADKAIELLWRSDDDGLSRYRMRLWRNLFALSQTWAALGLHYPAAPRPLPEFQQVIARMRDIAASWGGEVLLVYVPRVERFRGGLDNDFVYDQSCAPFFSAASAAGVPTIDLIAAFDTEADPLSLYAEDGHFSPKGSAYLANLIAAYADERYFDTAPEIASSPSGEDL